MKMLSLTPSPRRRFNRRWTRPGVTLLELSVVILVLLTFATLLMLRGQAWKRGSDRAFCVANQAAIQKSVRGYANLHNRRPGESVAGLESMVIGVGKFHESLPTCPGAGTYGTIGDQVPHLGELYMTCSLAAANGHQPNSFTGW